MDILTSDFNLRLRSTPREVEYFVGSRIAVRREGIWTTGRSGGVSENEECTDSGVNDETAIT